MTEPRIRVLHLAHGLGRGGTEKTLQLFVTHLDRKRFDPFVFAFADGERGKALRQAGVPVIVGPDLLAALERIRPHLVHIHRAGWPEPRLLRTLRLAGTPKVVETNVFGRFDPSPGAKVIDKHLFVSRFCLERYARDNGVDADDPGLGYLYNPVDTDFYDRQDLKRDWAKPVFGRLSRPDPGKWSGLALDVLPLVKARIPDFKCRMIGAVPEAFEFVRAKNLEQNVEFCESVNGEAELAGFFDGVNVLAHANDAGESFGLAIAEAMAAGLPVVTHPAAGNRDNAQLELVDHGVTGLVAGNAEEYAAALVRLMTRPDEAETMGRAGRDKAKRLFRVQNLVTKLENIYEQLLSDTPHAAHGHTNARAPVQRLHQGSPAL